MRGRGAPGEVQQYSRKMPGNQNERLRIERELHYGLTKGTHGNVWKAGQDSGRFAEEATLP